MDTREEYEQLKRKNRNRLIGAIVLVAAISLILLAVTDKKTPPTQPEVKISGRTQQANEPLNLPTGKENSTQLEKTIEEEQPIIIDSVAQPDLPFEPVTDSPVEKRSTSQTTPTKPTTDKSTSQSTSAKTAAEKSTSQSTSAKTAAEKSTSQSTSAKTVAKKSTSKPVEKITKKTETKPATQTTQSNQGKKAETKRPQQEIQSKKPSPKDILEGRANNNYFVQMGAFKTQSQADTQRAKLAQVGISSKIYQGKDKNGNTIYRVRSNSFATRDEAQQILNTAKTHKFDAMIVTQ